MPARLPFRRFLRSAAFLCRAAGLAGMAALASQCAHQTPVLHTYSQPRLADNRFVSHDGNAFGYRKWVNDSAQVRTVVVALHGFDGAAIDFENLGKHLTATCRGTALYACELRGQGSDPVRKRRGDIDNPANWRHDLLTFTDLVRKRHPRAKIVWAGESMGAIIAVHTYAECLAADATSPPCDAILLSSPVVAIRGDFPKWKQDAVLAVARLFPDARVSLEALAGGQDVQMTETSVHSEQAETNSWHVEKNTLRLLASLGEMIKGMDQAAASLRGPVLIAHGGKDFFTDAADVVAFCGQMQRVKHVERLFYPHGHHLLMYDTGREQVIADMTDWIRSLPR